MRELSKDNLLRKLESEGRVSHPLTREQIEASKSRIDNDLAGAAAQLRYRLDKSATRAEHQRFYA